MRRFSSFIERFGPWVLAIPLGLFAWFSGFEISSDKSESLVGGSLTVSALFVGFLATSKSIMMSYKGSRIFTQLKKTGHLRRMVGYLRFAIYSSLSWLGLGFAMYFVQSRLISCVWSFLATLSVASFIRIVHLQSKLIES